MMVKTKGQPGDIWMYGSIGIEDYCGLVILVLGSEYEQVNCVWSPGYCIMSPNPKKVGLVDGYRFLDSGWTLLSRIPCP